MERAARLADEIWHRVAALAKVGMTEKDIGRLIDSEIAKEGYTNSFATIVNAGSKTPAGHAKPTDARLARGDLLHVDFGIRLDGFCSDIQRLLYLQAGQ